MWHDGAFACVGAAINWSSALQSMLCDHGQDIPPPSQLASFPCNLPLSSHTARFSRHRLDLGRVDGAEEGEAPLSEPAVAVGANGECRVCSTCSLSDSESGTGHPRRVRRAAEGRVATAVRRALVATAARARVRARRLGVVAKVPDVCDTDGGGWLAMEDEGAVGAAAAGGVADAGTTGDSGAQQEWLGRRVAKVGNSRWVVAQLLAMQTQLAASKKVVVAAVVDESNGVTSVAVDESIGQRASGQVRMHALSLWPCTACQ
jgi:hypothetical protein